MMAAPVLDIEPGEGLGRLGGDRDDGLLHDPALLQAPDEHPRVHEQGGLLQEALGGWISRLDLDHELSQLPPLLPLRPRHVLGDLTRKFDINTNYAMRHVYELVPYFILQRYDSD